VAEPLCKVILEKIHEQIERTDHLIGIVSPEQMGWAPDIPGTWRTAVVMSHLLECLSGFCAVLVAVHPNKLGHFHRLRDLRGIPLLAATEARDRLAVYLKHIDEGFAVLEDGDLAKRIPTVFVKGGEPTLMLLLGNLEHLINHKHQLFMYLKLAGASVTSEDLYRFRTEG
jgi:hypothetical protein